MTRSRVIIVDDFYKKPDAVREWALKSQYADITPSDFPGFGSKGQIDSAALRQRFSTLVGSELNIDSDRFNWGRFRFITEESGRQPKVHADAEIDWAGMVYLSPDAPMEVGTAFFRHKETGLERPPTDREARRLGFGDAQEFNDKVIDRDKTDFEKWERVGFIGPVFNRLILFRGCEFYHAPMGGCGNTAETARLTHSFFFNTITQRPAAAHRVRLEA